MSSSQSPITIEMIEKNAPELLEYYANKCPSNAQDFYKNLYKALKKISKKAYQQRNYKVNHSEEELASFFSTELQTMLFDSERECDRSGHVDIVVRASLSEEDIEWYGECKILAPTGSNWDIHQGYLQLTTRYAFGNYDEHGVIVFNKKNNAIERLKDWWEYLSDKEKIDFKIDCNISDMAFFTKCKDESTGRLKNIRHLFVPLFYQPKDKSAVNSK
ncbi:hypothetical protein M4B70_22205 [Klebsiella pneumoniae]|uniref:hypothetical protein n=1 Tax=Klebsiella pneumoniae complex TaxID=3390273 RepID=UPI000E2E13DC|nr:MULTISPECIES: hypothetical protein [Klebsiella]HDS2191404.1 hypothetical protein [Klebsiella pneumoniae subsp. pneumoniae]EKW8306240.1 hypothetical protein [Klebsiella pneumoniae]ELB4274206.1 hypothetical protein [Klebsiella pneumoniae]ELC2286205.1 hypothetical protein [Klebsiella pneumoniae]MCM6300480.1 hypothetical protein [Klebsiella pneumoniae]